jgi:hypothetical protein
MNNKQLDLIKSILQSHIDAKKEFEKALEYLDTREELRDWFTTLRDKHEEHIDILEAVLDNEGYIYEIEESFTGMIARVFTDLRLHTADNKNKSALKNTRSVLRSLEGKYEETEELGYPESVNNVLVENLMEVRSTIDDIDTFLKVQY